MRQVNHSCSSRRFSAVRIDTRSNMGLDKACVQRAQASITATHAVGIGGHERSAGLRRGRIHRHVVTRLRNEGYCVRGIDFDRLSCCPHSKYTAMLTPYSGMMYTQRRSAFAFWLGSLLVVIGVVLHIPMFWMGRHIGFRLAGMLMDSGMYWGMALIVLGIVAAGYGLLPITLPDHHHEHAATLGPPEDAPLSRAHALLMAALAVGLIIDIMKPAS